MLFASFVQLTGKDRNPQSNLILGGIMALIAGAVNAGGFFCDPAIHLPHDRDHFEDCG